MADSVSAAAETTRRWRANPEQFVYEVLKVKEIEKWQLEALRALPNNMNLSVRSGHGVGKSAFLSWVIYWFATTHFPFRIPCTAPTAHQLQDVLWGELALWRRKMDQRFQNLFDITSDRLTLRAAPQEGYAVARTARPENPEAFQGFHCENILFIADEASGVDDAIFAPLEGALTTPGARSILTANPTRASGFFYDTHHRNRKHYYCMKASCLDSKLVSKEYEQKMRDQYGINSNVYRVRVMGEFPTEDADVLVPLSIVEPAVGREVVALEYAPVWGLDVARYGSCLNALAKRQANVLLEPISTWGNCSTMETSGRLLREYKATPYEMRPAEILVDVIGVGAGVYDRCEEMGLPVVAVNVGEEPSRMSDGRFARLRDELWWNVREWFASLDNQIPDDAFLIGELCTVRYGITSTGKIKVEGKAEMIARNVPSPDRADSLMLTMAGGLQVTEPRAKEKYQSAAKNRRRTFMAS